MEEVTVKVEKERMAEFFAMYSKFLESAPPAIVAAEAGGAEPWGLEDIEEARYVWDRMSGKARDLVKILLTASTDVSSEKLAEALGPNAGADTVAGTFAWPARYAIEVGRVAPTRGGKTSAGTVYWLEPVVKTLFEKVAAEEEGEE